MLAIDTNALVRLLVRDDVKQSSAVDKLVEKGAWVSHLVLAESLWVLEAVYERTSAQQITAIEMLLNHRTLVIQDAHTVSAALVLFSAKPSLGFSDCLILAISRQAGHSPMATFDKAFSKLDGTQLVSSK